MKVYFIFLFMFFLSCLSIYDAPISSEITDQIKIIPKLKLREAILKDSILSIVFIDSSDHYNPITASQKIEYGLSFLSRTRKEIGYEYVGVIFKMPNRQGGDVDFGALKHDDLVKALSIFQDTMTSRIIDTLMIENYRSRDGQLLEGIDEFLAHLIYGNEMTTKAFFGVDAFYIIFGCVNELKANQKGQNTELILQLIQNSQSKENKFKNSINNIFKPVIEHKWQ